MNQPSVDEPVTIIVLDDNEISPDKIQLTGPGADRLRDRQRVAL